MIRGSCLCANITFELTGSASGMSHCHCSMCRKAHGSSFATYLMLAADQIRWTKGKELLCRHESAPGSFRHFCPCCGSTMPGATDKFAFVPAGLLLDDCTTRAESHFFAPSKAPWYRITDDLPQYQDFPPDSGFTTQYDQPPRRPAQADAIGGSCLCDAVRFEISVKPDVMVNCHCSRCRLSRGAAHATNLFVEGSGFHWVRGEDLVENYKLPTARGFGTAFCSTCGSLLPRVSPAAERINIPAGSLDTDPGLTPRLHIYVGSKAPWFEITDDLPQFEESPPRQR
jgi:hypothetical protein